MPAYRAPKDTEVSTNVGGEEVRVHFADKPRHVADEGLVDVLEVLAADPDNPVHHARTEKKE